jgi:hypothetical protein
MAHKGKDPYGELTGPSVVEEEEIPLPPTKPRKKKKQTKTNKRGGGMVGKNKLIKGYKKGGQV